jgi:hypothetical protein
VTLPSEGLLKARELIARGWCQGAFGIGDRFCLVGALRHVMGNNCLEAYRFAVRVVPGDVVRWNDAPGRLHRSVLNALESAARIARSEGR